MLSPPSVLLTPSGNFLPTRRTPAISTSDLLERIVRGYRDGFFDSKLEKNGHSELLAADVDWDSSASIEKRESRKKKAQVPTMTPT
jgi:choline-phosphate cytidylyltransferase